MPFTGDIFSYTAGTSPGPASTVISSSKRSQRDADVEAAINTTTSVARGGTGATTVITAHDALNTKGSDISSSGTINLSAATGVFIDITGSTEVTTVTLAEGEQRMARAAGAFNLAAGANLIVNASESVDYTTTAGDLLYFVGYAAGIVRVWAGTYIADGAVTTVKLADDAVTAAKIADDSITNDKLTVDHSLSLSHAVDSRIALKALDTARFNVAYLQESGREGWFSWDASDLSTEVTADTAEGTYVPPTGDATGASGAWVRPRKGDLHKTSEYGDDVQVAIDTCLAQGGGTVEIDKKGTIALTEGLVLPGEVELVGLGRDVSVLDFGGVTTLGDFAYGGSAIYVKGTGANTFTTLPSFSGVGVGEFTIQFAAPHGLVVGDVVNITDQTDWSFCGYRDYYWKGWVSRVIAIESNKVYLLHGSPSNLTYNASTCVARKLPARKGKFGGFSLDLTGHSVSIDSYGMWMEFADGVELDDFGQTGATRTGIYLTRSHGIRANRLKSHTRERSTFTGNDYAMIVGNSQNLRIRGDFTGNWAGTDIGGGSQDGSAHNYLVEYNDCDIRSSSTVAASGTHGNMEDSGYTNCRIEGGASLSGKNPYYRDCDIKLTRGSNTVLMYASEMVAGNAQITDCKMYTTKNPGGSSQASLSFGASGSADIYSGGKITYAVIGGSLECTSDVQPVYVYNNSGVASPDTILVEGAPTSTYYPTNIDIDIEIKTPSATEYLRVRNNSGSGIADFCRLKQRGEFESGVNFATFISYTATNYDFPETRISETIVTTAAANVVSGTTHSFSQYPLQPNVQLSCSANASGEVPIPYAYAKSVSSLRIGMLKGGGGAFTASLNMVIDATVKL